MNAPRRGRPRSANPKTPAQRQKEYRERLKALSTPTLAQALAGFELWHLPKGCRKWRKTSGPDALSWQAVQAQYRGALLANDLLEQSEPDYPELTGRYEIRPASSA